jgi:hypothetical protein
MLRAGPFGRKDLCMNGPAYQPWATWEREVRAEVAGCALSAAPPHARRNV